jgi:hypothetical protein
MGIYMREGFGIRTGLRLEWGRFWGWRQTVVPDCCNQKKITVSNRFARVEVQKIVERTRWFRVEILNTLSRRNGDFHEAGERLLKSGGRRVRDGRLPLFRFN